MFSNAIVYEGNEPYLFVSGCPQDAELLAPVLDQLGYDGFRIWYDEDDTAKNAANYTVGGKVLQCSVFLVLLTAGYASSHVCRQTLNTAMESGRTIRILHLQETALPPSLALQLTRAGCPLKPEAQPQSLRLQALCADPAVKGCRAEGSTFYQLKKKPAAEPEKEPVKEVVKEPVREPVKEPVKELAKEPAKEPVKEPAKEPVKEPVREPVKEPVKEPEKEPVKEPVREPAKEPVREPVKEPVKEPVREAEEETVFEEDETVLEYENEEETCLDDPDDLEDEEKTSLNEPNAMTGLLFRLSDESCRKLEGALIRLGRSAWKCDIAIPDNTSVSNYHADIIQYRGVCYLRDAGSANGTFMNGEKIEEDDRRVLESPALFCLSDERFLFVSGTAAEDLLEQETVVFLQNTRTKEKYIVTEDVLPLGRRHIWPEGTLDDAKISREHARIFRENGTYFLEDIGGRNGTYVGSGKIAPNEPVALEDGMRIRLGNTVLQVGFRNMSGMLAGDPD